MIRCAFDFEVCRIIGHRVVVFFTTAGGKSYCDHDEEIEDLFHALSGLPVANKNYPDRCFNKNEVTPAGLVCPDPRCLGVMAVVAAPCDIQGQHVPDVPSGAFHLGIASSGRKNGGVCKEISIAVNFQAGNKVSCSERSCPEIDHSVRIWCNRIILIDRTADNPLVFTGRTPALVTAGAIFSLVVAFGLSVMGGYLIIVGALFATARQQKKQDDDYRNQGPVVHLHFIIWALPDRRNLLAGPPSYLSSRSASHPLSQSAGQLLKRRA